MIRFIFRKIDTAKAFILMFRKIENIFSSKIQTLACINRNSVKWIWSDGGGVDFGHEFQNWRKQKGIVHEITTASLPESNDRPERLNGTLLDIARTILLSIANAPPGLWAETVNTACHIRSRLITRSCQDTCTSYEVNPGNNPV